MKRYDIKKGRSKFTPWQFPYPVRTKKLFLNYQIRFSDSCWYDWRNGTDQDQDQYDINKIGGVADLFQFRNHNSFRFGWRPAKERNVFELLTYEKDRNGNFDFDVLATVKSGDLAQLTLYNTDRLRITAQSPTTPKKTIFTKPLDFKFGRVSNLHFGGENNSEGEFGGVASQDMSLELKFNYSHEWI